jgi:hypothetical protein
METNVSQRWRDGRSTFRPPGEVINPREYEIERMEGDAEAKRFVCRMHYSGSYPASRFRYGLYRRGALVGVAVFSVPCNNRVLTNSFTCDPAEATELGRFVLDDSVAFNGESWMLSRCFELLRREGIKGVVSFSDPVPRTTAAGEITHVGHVGIIYQACSARFVGLGTPRRLLLLPDGRVMSARALSKIRRGERGWRYAAALLAGIGAGEPPEEDEARRAWLRSACSRLRRLDHPGNFKYLFGLDQRIVKYMPPPLAYPKCRLAPGRTANPAQAAFQWAA